MAKVLIVDDESAIRRLLGTWIQRAGHEVREAASAEDALVDMATSPSEVVFCDLVMPGHDGLWLTDQLRSHFPAAALILATGLGSVPPSKSMQEGVMGYLIKPFDRDDVLEAVDTGATLHALMASRSESHAGMPSVEEWADSLG